jgi:hypothetical protein
MPTCGSNEEKDYERADSSVKCALVERVCVHKDAFSCSC